MKLSNAESVESSESNIDSAKAIFSEIIADLQKNEANIRKSITNEQNIIFSDALAIGKILHGNMDKLDGESFKRHASKFKQVIKTALFEEDYDYLRLRKEVKDHQKALVKDIPVHGLSTDTEYVVPFADNPTNQGGKTASSLSPLLMSERIMRDLNSKFYVSAQDAYDGYTQKHGLWIFASPNQKCILAEILRYNGFKINDEEWQKQAKEDYDEYFRLHKNFGKGEADPNYKYIKNTIPTEDRDKKVVEAADYTNSYCNNCKATKQFSTKDGKPYACKSCGTVKSNHTPKKSIISMIRKAQMDQARPNVLQLVIKQLMDNFNSFKQPITPIDVKENLTKVIDQNYPDQTENAEEKEYMMQDDQVNSVILNQVLQTLKEQNIPVVGNANNTATGYRASPEQPRQMSEFQNASKSSLDKDKLINKRIEDFYKEAFYSKGLSEEVQKWVSNKIEYLIKEEKLDSKAAEGKAFGMAREKFGPHSVPKK